MFELAHWPETRSRRCHVLLLGYPFRQIAGTRVRAIASAPSPSTLSVHGLGGTSQRFPDDRPVRTVLDDVLSVVREVDGGLALRVAHGDPAPRGPRHLVDGSRKRLPRPLSHPGLVPVSQVLVRHCPPQSVQAQASARSLARAALATARRARFSSLRARSARLMLEGRRSATSRLARLTARSAPTLAAAVRRRQRQAKNLRYRRARGAHEHAGEVLAKDPFGPCRVDVHDDGICSTAQAPLVEVRGDWWKGNDRNGKNGIPADHPYSEAKERSRCADDSPRP